MHRREKMEWNRIAVPIAIGALIWLAAPAWGHERVQQSLAPSAGSPAIGQARPSRRRSS